MEILNSTIGGGPNAVDVVFGSLFLIFFAVLLFLTVVIIKLKSVALSGLTMLFALCSLFMASYALTQENPTRHEVILHEGHVLDATKYEIIEQRGNIYVIKEREVSE